MYEAVAILTGGSLEATASLTGGPLLASAELITEVTVVQILDPYTTETGNGSLITQ